MITQERASSGSPLSHLSEYDVLLDTLQDVTAELVAAIDAWDSDKVEELIETRSGLCERIGKSIQAISAQNADETGSVDSSVVTMLNEALTKHESLVAQQTAAERKLGAELRRRRPAMARMNAQQGGHRAYRRASSSQQSRFLDSRL